MGKFKAAAFDIHGTTWKDFSAILSTTLPEILTSSDLYFADSPPSQQLVQYIRMDQSLCKGRIDFYVAGQELSHASGKFAIAFAEIIDAYAEKIEAGEASEANRLAEEYESEFETALLQAVHRVSKMPAFQQAVTNRGYVLKLKDADSRGSAREIFPTRE